MKVCSNSNQLFMLRNLAAQTSAGFCIIGAADCRHILTEGALLVRQPQFVRWVQQLILGCVLVLTALPHSLAAKILTGQPPLILGVHPYKSAVTLVESYKPLASYLSHKTGRTITVRITRDYSTHIQLIGEDKLDIAYMGPASYVDLVMRYGKKPLLARQAIHGNPTFQGKIVVHRDSTISSLVELVGKRFAFGDSASTMSHLVPRYMLRQAGVTVDRLTKHQFLGSHDNVALAVLAGDYDAGAVKEAVYKKYQARGLKVLATTPALSEHLFVTRSKLPAEVRRTLREALYILKDDPQGPAIMAGIKPGMTAWVPVTDTDYDNLRIILNALAREDIRP
jgi:phosphonate transport system substrate-binding protein